MIYKNPVVRGFYPDPSVCFANNKYYMVCSSFQFFPGVPIFESEDLVNWKQIGHCLTRKSQVMLENSVSSGGVFAPTIRFNNGTFYMVTTNTSVAQNFYVTTNNIYSEWSDPIFVEQDGIDPSLLFDGDHTYFISNGTDDNGNNGITQCEIDIKTGKKLTPSKTIWSGSGGRYLESPHMYKINGEYYLMAAEGGTEYGHMITYARSASVWGKFEPYEKNPVLTNRNLGGYMIQGVGHGDLIQNQNGDWFVIHLGFRQIDQWLPYHHLGREVFMTPIHFGENGWFTAGNDGTTAQEYEINGNFTQELKKVYTFENTSPDLEWCYMRHPDSSKYELSSEKYILHGTDKTIDDIASPTFIGLRQMDFNGEISCDLSVINGEAGITLFMDEQQHYDLAVRNSEIGTETVLKLNIGDIKHIQNSVKLSGNSAKLIIEMNNFIYTFKILNGDALYELGSAQTKYLSSEVAAGFTGVIIGLYAQQEGCKAEFTGFRTEYK